ncbi:carboxymuconolactone decarboxylase family protein [Rhodococcus sp. NCIMB 12038]|uniref:carboxymuconolactone decarboxylase family protein n=1 Tax=Rhodococcus sp. NCIMB 12038 TaxID=933800 RepID=UPI000B3C6879|nr:carboxymuconolactone decarboxylase family protein [Rhodococcus sp. NCIMB 12038]OUS82230.1 hypothetical protein CA951_41255 [Rhodococcus sp. NCIMB 12038]
MAAFVSNPELQRRGRELQALLYDGELGEEMRQRYRRKSPDIADMSREWAVGGLIGRPGLDLKTRELLCVVLSVVSGPGCGPINDPVIAHAQACLRVGATKREIYETILQCIWYLGAGPVHIALTALSDFFDEEFFDTAFDGDEDR